ncbi:MAG: AAA family ATPase [Magnetococcales bacterium]|nr:AAA family ATPase [Magnetococcales bacterium]
MFRFKTLRLVNYRCFATLDLDFEPDLTVLFAENGEGKSAILNAMALGLSVFQPGTPRGIRLDWHRDPRLVTLDERGRREPAGDCTIAWMAEIGDRIGVEWSTAVNSSSGRMSKNHRAALESIESIRKPGERWPLFAWYGTERMGRGRFRKKSVTPTRDRWEGYASSLDPSLTDAPLLEWLLEEIIGDTVRRQEGQPEHFCAAAVMDALVRATPGVKRAWYDPRERSPMVRFENGAIATWSELSDGYHLFLALVADIARRAIMLNESDGGDAPAKVEGVVLIDEIDLHLHPRWQRVVLDGLREAFPRLQFIVTTHSPQVLSSAQNRHVRRLVNGKIQKQGVFVEGRDSNAILREFMTTDDRDESGAQELRNLYDAIDHSRREEAEQIYTRLITKWGDFDPELIRARGLMDDMEA